MLVREIFHSLQGEGPLVGTPATFIRFGGCHRSCWFCDTDFKEELSAEMSVRGVFRAVQHELVVLTGGEPMLQDLLPLITMLLLDERKVQIETAGDHWQDLPYEDITVVCSPKGKCVHPSLQPDAWKYVVAEGEEPSVHGTPVFIQPLVDGTNDQANTDYCVELCMERGYRLSLQTHKTLGLR
jgi:organic radical activating enzyme